MPRETALRPTSPLPVSIVLGRLPQPHACARRRSNCISDRYPIYLDVKRGFMRVQITRWGNSLGVRVPKQVAREIGLNEGSQVDIEAADHRIIITPARPRDTLADL